MRKELTISFIISFTFLSLGFILLHYELIGYGLSLFVFLPFILGYILGTSTIKKISLTGLVISLVIFFALLIAGGLEGMVCILMALPLVIGAIALGAFVNYLFKKNQAKDKPDELIKKSMLPFFFFLGLGLLEKEMTKNNKEVISVSSEMILPYSTHQVYETIKSVDTLIANKSFLMKLDLPVPNKCILEKEEVGGLRTCYFSGGTITERITELKKDSILRMDVIDYKLTGRKWLGFKEAIYYFEKTGETSCRMTRVTTYTSELKPRFYWDPLEKIGIRQEHDYVFENLKNDLEKKYSK
jgi:hypothetical protein